jgi:hypothetical protein
MQILTSKAPSVGHSAYPRALFMVLPEQFGLSQQSAQDNHYMQMQSSVDAALAVSQSTLLMSKLRAAGQTVIAFAGDAACPDGVFPNNVFATREQLGTAAATYLTARMRHPERQQECERADLHAFFAQLLSYQRLDLNQQLSGDDYAELTGCMVIDRARNIGFCGLSERCTLKGAKAMHEAFALNKTYVFSLSRQEYHTNVVLSALGGKGLVIAPSGFANANDAEQLKALYPNACIELSDAQKRNYAGNCIALADGQVWMSARAQASLSAEQRTHFQSLGFTLHTAELSELEKAGGSLRCMIGEIF